MPRTTLVRWHWAATGGAAAVVAFTVVMLVNPAGRPASSWLDGSAALIAALSIAGCAAFRAKRSRGRQRPAWTWIAIAGLLWAVGEAIWGWYALIGSGPVPYPSAADIAYLLAIPPAVVGLMLIGSRERGASRTLRNLLDGLVTAASLFFISWATVLSAVYGNARGTQLARVIDLSYPFTDVILATAAFMAISHASGGIRLQLRLFGAGLLCFAVADSSYAYLNQLGTNGNGNVLDAGYIAGALLICLAALRPQREASSRTADRHPSTVQIFFPYIPLGFAGLTAVIKWGEGGRFDATLVLAGIVTVLLAVLRQLIALADNQRLARQLGASLDDLRAHEIELRRQASHDPLTGLANRVLFADRVDAAAGRRPTPVRTAAVMVCDLDDFKAINDSLGHLVGDEVLRTVADRLIACTRDSDTIARLGGDEFAILLEDVPEVGVVTETAQRIIEELRFR